MKKLRYVGPQQGEPGFKFVPGVPTTDFDCEDEKLAANLVKSKRYEYVKEPKAEGGER